MTGCHTNLMMGGYYNLKSIIQTRKHVRRISVGQGSYGRGIVYYAAVVMNKSSPWRMYSIFSIVLAGTPRL